jgi:molybdopterin synthase catalytic subunit
VTAPTGDTWTGLTDRELPVAAASAWAVQPGCGGVVTFTGTARDHGAGRTDITELDYEAYEPYAGQRLEAVAAEVRRRWPTAGRVALLHRIGVVAVQEAAVVVVVSAPHRDEAFAAARFVIDEVKATVPLWKREIWPGGSSWTEPCASHAGVAS